MRLSLRGRLGLLWALIVVTCVSLGVIMWGMYRQGAGFQIEAGERKTQNACVAIQDAYRRYVAAPGSPPEVKPDLLYVILELTLRDVSAVEGGVWQADGGFVAYAYPTYEGTGVKRDVPEAEKPRLAKLAEASVVAQAPKFELQRGQREALIAAACPLPGTSSHAAWTLTRVPAALAGVYDRLAVGLGVLLVFMLASGAWVGTLTFRWAQRLSSLEEALGRYDFEHPPQLPPAGEQELDRIVHALNRFSDRLRAAGEESARLGRELARSERLAALGRMTAGIAHEIRNPIAAMRLKAENAIAQPGPRQAAALETILEQIGRLDTLVQSMLAMTQPFELNPQTVDVKAWLDEPVHALQESADAAGVDVHVTSSLERWVFDPLHVGRALDNLLRNALQHTPYGGEITVEAREVGGKLIIRVHDSGLGVPAPQRNHIFEPFATGRADGIGLGLALAREIMLAHGGDVRLVEPQQGEAGATFELELPWHKF